LVGKNGLLEGEFGPMGPSDGVAITLAEIMICGFADRLESNLVEWAGLRPLNVTSKTKDSCGEKGDCRWDLVEWLLFGVLV
jgi:hypothetical protein